MRVSLNGSSLHSAALSSLSLSNSYRSPDLGRSTRMYLENQVNLAA